MRKILLDTNGYTKFLLGDKAILEELGKADKVFISTIVLGELFAGFQGGTQESKNKKMLEKFLAKSRVEIVPVGQETAEIFGEVKYNLLRRGTPLPINDIWIACCAIEVGAIVISYDEHFAKIPGVRIWNGWQN
ncbi:type II toxin-antitoxin system VapC family toxin [Candidatus Woesebacteria bacterium]|nr:type II toxin-antitoxin system VapC family toxin [Candidatus Woesebacteria bacterium]